MSRRARSLPIPSGTAWDPEYNRDISQIQDTTYWSFKAGTRYEAGHALGLAGTVRIQSGFPWAPIAHPNIPIVGTQAVFLQDLNQNRSQTAAIVDFRVDKAFTFGGKYKAMVMADLYNLFNSNAETNFILSTGSSYNNIIEWLGGRTLQIGAAVPVLALVS